MLRFLYFYVGSLPNFSAERSIIINCLENEWNILSQKITKNIDFTKFILGNNAIKNNWLFAYLKLSMRLFNNTIK